MVVTETAADICICRNDYMSLRSRKETLFMVLQQRIELLR